MHLLNNAVITAVAFVLSMAASATAHGGFVVPRARGSASVRPPCGSRSVPGTRRSNFNMTNAVVSYNNAHDSINATVQLAIAPVPTNDNFTVALGDFVAGPEETVTSVFNLTGVAAVGTLATVRVTYTLHDSVLYDCADVILVQ
ncbi:hypothetical protein HDU96_010815 [Phlyctochytrium bullatum]|nr:hypothetical protein HDU96_010815 [Phlyctochytrium bullatum]